MSTNNELGLDVGQANELKLAFRREGPWTNEEIKILCEQKGLLTSVREVLLGRAKITTTNILQSIKQGIEIPALTEPFVVKDHFVNGKEITFYFGSNFTNWFLGQTVPTHQAVRLDVWKITENSRDDRILSEIGSEKHEVTLDVVFTLVNNQSKGEDGILLTNGYANVFYVKDTACVLRAVFVVWGGDGWGVNADSVGDQREWYEGFQVFSRNSVT